MNFYFKIQPAQNNQYKPQRTAARRIKIASVKNYLRDTVLPSSSECQELTTHLLMKKFHGIRPKIDAKKKKPCPIPLQTAGRETAQRNIGPIFLKQPTLKAGRYSRNFYVKQHFCMLGEMKLKRSACCLHLHGPRKLTSDLIRFLVYGNIPEAQSCNSEMDAHS